MSSGPLVSKGKVLGAPRRVTWSQWALNTLLSPCAALTRLHRHAACPGELQGPRGHSAGRGQGLRTCDGVLGARGREGVLTEQVKGMAQLEEEEESRKEEKGQGDTAREHGKGTGVVWGEGVGWGTEEGGGRTPRPWGTIRGGTESGMDLCRPSARQEFYCSPSQTPLCPRLGLPLLLVCDPTDAASARSSQEPRPHTSRPPLEAPPGPARRARKAGSRPLPEVSRSPPGSTCCPVPRQRRPRGSSFLRGETPTKGGRRAAVPVVSLVPAETGTPGCPRGVWEAARATPTPLPRLPGGFGLHGTLSSARVVTHRKLRMTKCGLSHSYPGKI